MKKQSQCNRVMQYMRDFGSISTREAFDDLGVTRLSGRIYDLKKQGVPIADSMEKSKNRYGETVTTSDTGLTWHAVSLRFMIRCRKHNRGREYGRRYSIFSS